MSNYNQSLSNLKKKTVKEVNNYLNMKFGSANQNFGQFDSDLNNLLSGIAKTGIIPSSVEWDNLKNFLIIKLVDVCIEINTKYNDFHDDQNLVPRSTCPRAALNNSIA